MQTEALKKYRESAKEKQRAEQCLALLPPSSEKVLEIGCREGYFTLQLAQRYPLVYALDLEMPSFDAPENVIKCRGDITRPLDFADSTFDLVVCTEVLEHIDPERLSFACSELIRVCNDRLLISVPYRQDLRVNAMICAHCGAWNPTSGHRTTFDSQKLLSLFTGCTLTDRRYVASGPYLTNRLSYKIYSRFGFPYGSYAQAEPCIACGQPLQRPRYTAGARLCCLAAKIIEALQNRILFAKRKKIPLWIEMVFKKVDTQFQP